MIFTLPKLLFKFWSFHTDLILSLYVFLHIFKKKKYYGFITFVHPCIVCRHIRSLQPSNRFESKQERIFLRTLEPAVLIISRNTTFMPGHLVINATGLITLTGSILAFVFPFAFLPTYFLYTYLLLYFFSQQYRRQALQILSYMWKEKNFFFFVCIFA